MCSSYTIEKSSFDYLLTKGAISIEYSPVAVSIYCCLFSNCSRSEKSGGAILLESLSGSFTIINSIGIRCNTNDINNNKDNGQFSYLHITSGTFKHERCSFDECHIDISKKRHACNYMEGDKLSHKEVNCTNNVCHRASFFSAKYFTVLEVSHIKLSNSNNTAEAGPMIFYTCSGTVKYISLINCHNSIVFTPTTSAITFSNINIVRSTKFEDLYAGDNIIFNNLATEFPIYVLNIYACKNEIAQVTQRERGNLCCFICFIVNTYL